MHPARTIQYIANIRLPTEKAHGAQIMKTCEALASLGVELELIVPSRRTHITDDTFAYYAVKKNFNIVRLPVIDTVALGKLGFWLETISFAISAAVYIFFHKKSVVYSRDEAVLWFVSLFITHTVWESHTGRYNFFTRRLLRANKKCVVISEGLKDFYIKKSAAATIDVAPDAIDLAAFSNPQSMQAARARLSLPSDKKIVLYIGQLDGWKGTDTLFEASKHLPSHSVVAVIGGELKQIEKHSAQYPDILFLGTHPYRELADNQAAADVLVLPNTAKEIISAKFTSPMKLFSYMTSGKPIVASDLPSVREIVDETSAIFFTPDDPLSLAKSITTVLDNPELGASLGARAKKEVTKYTWEARAQNILSFIF